MRQLQKKVVTLHRDTIMWHTIIYNYYIMTNEMKQAFERVEYALGALSLEMMSANEMQHVTEIGAALLIINNIKTTKL